MDHVVELIPQEDGEARKREADQQTDRKVARQAGRGLRTRHIRSVDDQDIARGDTRRCVQFAIPLQQSIIYRTRSIRLARQDIVPDRLRLFRERIVACPAELAVEPLFRGSGSQIFSTDGFPHIAGRAGQLAVHTGDIGFQARNRRMAGKVAIARCSKLAFQVCPPCHQALDRRIRQHRLRREERGIAHRIPARLRRDPCLACPDRRLVVLEQAG